MDASATGSADCPRPVRNIVAATAATSTPAKSPSVRRSRSRFITFQPRPPGAGEEVGTNDLWMAEIRGRLAVDSWVMGLSATGSGGAPTGKRSADIALMSQHDQTGQGGCEDDLAGFRVPHD